MRKPFNEEAERWLTHARDEFADADELRHRQRFYMALFHFQQAAEKALKAYLLAAVKSVEVLRTHAVGDLVATATAADPEFESLRPAKRLDQYYLPTRYPNSLPGGIPSRFYDDPDEAAEASRLAGAVLELVGRKLGF
jgi:HEPN domain-containing protein